MRDCMGLAERFPFGFAPFMEPFRASRAGSMTRRELNAEARRTQRDSHSTSLRAGAMTRRELNAEARRTQRHSHSGFAPFMEFFRASGAGSRGVQRRNSAFEPPHTKTGAEREAGGGW